MTCFVAVPSNSTWRHIVAWLTEIEQIDLKQMIEYLPELEVLRQFADRMYGLFDTQKDFHQASCRLATIVRNPQFQAVPELVKAMEQLDEEKFPKLMAYLNNPVSQRVRTNQDGLESNQDGLESAKPDLQSMFKKPGEDFADHRLRVAVGDASAERRLRRRQGGCRRVVTEVRGRAAGDDLRFGEWCCRPGDDCKAAGFRRRRRRRTGLGLSRISRTTSGTDSCQPSG
jgi:hypothetical protein